MERQERLYALAAAIADGQFASGEDLGRKLGVTRAAVADLVNGLRTLGMPVYSVPGRGHRAAYPWNPLDRQAIRAQLSEDASRTIHEVATAFCVDSTNAVLQRQARDLQSGYALFAEGQTAGRGRRGRQWSSPFGAGLCGSLYWRFRGGVGQLGGLSLAVGVAVAQALAAAGVGGVGLKWPNDIMCEGRKLGGILIEAGGEMNANAYAIIGIGLNVRMPADAAQGIDQPWIDIARTGGNCDRSWLAAVLLNELVTALTRFESDGMTAFHAEWERLDVLHGVDVQVLLPDRTVVGRCHGIDSSGLLLVEQGGELLSFAYGDVSLRKVVS